VINSIYRILEWIKQDWDSHPVRCFLEIIAWMLSIICSVTMMVTVPAPPFLMLYPMFITQCIIFAWSAWTRQSFGLLANYTLLVTIDSIALARLVGLSV
jgi:hypothetical protein